MATCYNHSLTSSFPAYSSAGLIILGFGFAGRDGGTARCALQSQLVNLLSSPGVRYYGAFNPKRVEPFTSFKVFEAAPSGGEDDVLDGVRWAAGSSVGRFEGTSLAGNVDYEYIGISQIDTSACFDVSNCGTPKSLRRLGLRYNQVMRKSASVLLADNQLSGYALAFDTSMYFPEPVVTREDALAVVERGEIRYLQVVSGGGVILGRTQDVVDVLEGRVSLPEVDGITSLRGKNARLLDVGDDAVENKNKDNKNINNSKKKKKEKEKEKKKKKTLTTFSNYGPSGWFFRSHAIPSTLCHSGYAKSIPGGQVGDDENVCMRKVKSSAMAAP